MAGEATVNVRAWPFEVKATVAIWIVAGIGVLTLGWFDATKSAWQVAFLIWWLFNVYVAMQATCYRRLGCGFFAMCWRMTFDAEFREHSRKILSQPIMPRLTRHFEKPDKH